MKTQCYRKQKNKKKQTKKHKHHHYSYKSYFINEQKHDKQKGGANTTPSIIQSNPIQQIQQQVQEERKKSQQEQEQKNHSHIVQDALNVSKELTANFIQNVGNKLGININNPTQFNQIVDNINHTLTNPETKAKMKEMIANSAQTGKDLMTAASPFLEPLIQKAIEETTKASSKIGESAVKIGLNTAEEIPGVGVVIGTVRSLSNAGEAITAATNAISEITTAYADTANATAKNWERLQAEKKAILAKTQDSIQKFTQPTNYLPTPKIRTKLPTYIKNK